MKMGFSRAFESILNSTIKSAATKKWRNESGQSVILISMVILSFLMFFSFAINTGVLITAKISVQAAADAAAYAGAATQARQLNAISYLNYDMRRQFKKFTYRYAFEGNIAARDFPNDPSGLSGTRYGYPKDWYSSEESISRTALPIGVPVVCIPITGTATKSDNCTQINLPSTAKQTEGFFPGGGLTAITQQLLQTVQQIQQMQEDQCQKTSSANFFVLIEWLFRGDIKKAAISATLAQMSNGMLADDKQKLEDTVSGLVNGLGLYPRNIITLMRIETLIKFLNEPAKKDLQKDAISSLEHAPNAEVNERTIQAFKSALSNLNNEVIAHDTVIMQELQNDNQITINPVKASFNAYVQYMNTVSTSGSATICNSKILPFMAKKVPVGVVRTGNVTVPVHYAVKLTAKAKLLFLPIKEGIELEAFASAKPFGSRIGPANLSEKDFVEKITPGTIGTEVINDCSDSEVGCKVPNLTISGTDTYYTQKYLQALATIGFTTNPDGSKTYKFPGGWDNAIAPQAHEIGHYNVIPPPKPDSEMALEYIPYAKDQNSKIYRVYAPIFTGSGDPATMVQTFMDDVFGGAQVSGNNAFQNVDMMALKATLQAELIAYINGPLNTGGTNSEDGETTTFAALQLPMAPLAPLAPSPYWLTKSEEVRSSWGPDYLIVDSTGSKKFQPRFGYSVKFVAMQNLLQSGSLGPDADQSKVSH